MINEIDKDYNGLEMAKQDFLNTGAKSFGGTFMHMALRFGDRVLIDGKDGLHAVVTAFNFSSDGAQSVQCKWFTNGEHRSEYFESWRLKVVEP